MLTDTDKAQAVRDYCAQTSGTDGYHTVTLLPLAVTDGMLFLAQTCGAFWLLDLVASHQPEIRAQARGTDFQVWRIMADPDNASGCVVDAWTDTPESPADDAGPASILLAEQRVEFTDFPRELMPFEFWVKGGVCLLKEEY